MTLDRLAFAIAVLRGLISLAFSMGLMLAPEAMMPGSSAEPAHTLAVFFVSRLVALSIAFIGLAVTGRRRALAGLFVADAALQVFDMAWPALHGQLGPGLAVPLVIGAAEVWAARRLTNINAQRQA